MDIDLIIAYVFHFIFFPALIYSISDRIAMFACRGRHFIVKNDCFMGKNNPIEIKIECCNATFNKESVNV